MIFAAGDPKSDCEEIYGVFPGGFPHHVVDLGPPHSFTTIPTVGGEASATATQTRIGAARRAANHDIKGINRCSNGTDTGTGTGRETLHKRCARLRALGY
jgi:hypothetical protein